MNSKTGFKLLSAAVVFSMVALACQTTVLPDLSEFNFEQVTATPVVETEPTEDLTPITPQPTLSSSVDPVPVGGDLISSQEALISLYRNVSPGVVSIVVLSEIAAGSGSGFVIDKEGHIVTNYHVVQEAQEIQVTFPSGVKVRAEVIGEDFVIIFVVHFYRYCSKLL